jgi:hypothetical protein
MIGRRHEIYPDFYDSLLPAAHFPAVGSLLPLLSVLLGVLPGIGSTAWLVERAVAGILAVA